MKTPPSLPAAVLLVIVSQEVQLGAFKLETTLLLPAWLPLMVCWRLWPCRWQRPWPTSRPVVADAATRHRQGGLFELEPSSLPPATLPIALRW